MVIACSTRYPLSMSETEWGRMSPQQQLDAREKQTKIDQKDQRIRDAQELHRVQKRIEA